MVLTHVTSWRMNCVMDQGEIYTKIPQLKTTSILINGDIYTPKELYFSIISFYLYFVGDPGWTEGKHQENKNKLNKLKSWRES